MPSFTLNTNIPKSKIPDNFLSETTKVVAKSLGKPESYVVIHVIPDQYMAFGGDSKEPCGNATLMSIGQLGTAQNKKHAAAIYKHIESTLGIKSSRFYIQFIDAPKGEVGYSGTTFDDLL